MATNFKITTAVVIKKILNLWWFHQIEDYLWMTSFLSITKMSYVYMASSTLYKQYEKWKKWGMFTETSPLKLVINLAIKMGHWSFIVSIMQSLKVKKRLCIIFLWTNITFRSQGCWLAIQGKISSQSAWCWWATRWG